MCWNYIFYVDLFELSGKLDMSTQQPVQKRAWHMWQMTTCLARIPRFAYTLACQRAPIAVQQKRKRRKRIGHALTF